MPNNVPKTVTYYGIPDSTRKFKPKYIRYYKISLSVDRATQLPFFTISPVKDETPATVDDAAVLDFIARRVAEPVVPKQMLIDAPVVSRSAEFAGIAPANAFEIRVKDPCYMVLELDKAYPNWQFDTTEEGITTKGDYAFKNTNLIHVGKDNKPISDQDLPTYDGCQFLYFRVVSRKDSALSMGAKDHQQYNLHVVFSAGGYSLKTIFDPDIKNDGGDFDGDDGP